jgi:TRAP-type C4-dicarboxylate transport system substrate-binding protein
MAIDVWAEIDKRSEGRVKTNVVTAGALLGAKEMFEGVKQGIADGGSTHTGYNRGNFPIMMIPEQPFGYSGGWASTRILNEFYEKFRPKEFDEVHMLMFHGDGVGFIGVHTTKTPVHTLEDIEGLVARAGGVSGDMFRALGGVTRDIAYPETYDALAKGVIEATCGSYEGMLTMKFAEQTKYSALALGMSNTYAFYHFMNLDTWNSLPGDIQKIITDTYYENRDRTGRDWELSTIAGLEYFLEMGGTLYVVPEDEIARWRALVDPLIATYEKSVVDDGYATEAEVQEMDKFIRERIAYWDGERAKIDLPTLESYVQ